MNTTSGPRPLDTTLVAEESAYLRAVEDRLDQYLGEQERLLESISSPAAELARAIRDLGAGGKRLRALFVHWGWRAARADRAGSRDQDHDDAGAGAGPESQDPAVRAGAALELFQSAALIHDDIIDHSDTRRGRPAVHKRFEAQHRAAGWAHEPAEYGLMSGIVAGDLCLALAESMFSSIGTEESSRGRSRGIFDLMRTEVMAGQYLDNLGEYVLREDTETALERALTVIRFKAAKYSCEHPLVLGAALAGGSPALLEGLSRVGLPLGEAFQLRDDVLGVFGEPATTGKPAGDDLREGKRTVLVAYALRGTTPEDAGFLDARLGHEDLTEEEIQRMRGIIRDSGALAAVEDLIRQKEEQAFAALRELPLGGSADGSVSGTAAEADAVREGLARMAERALHRTS